MLCLNSLLQDIHVEGYSCFSVSAGISKELLLRDEVVYQVQNLSFRSQNSHIATSNENTCYSHMATNSLFFILMLHALKRRMCFVRRVCEVAFFQLYSNVK